MQDLISICLAAYKPDPQYFLEQLESIQKQTHSHFICVITADSEVHLPESILQDSRFHLFQNVARKGPIKNFEEAARRGLHFKPSYISFADQDDIWFPSKLEDSLKALRQAPPLSAIHTDMKVVSADRQILSESAWTLEKRGIQNTRVIDLLIRNVVAGCGCLIDAEIVRRFLEIPDGVPMHDQWYPLLAARHGGMYPLERPTYEYRMHGANVCGVTEFSGLMQSTSLPSSQKTSDNPGGWMDVALTRYKETRMKALGLKQFNQLRSWESLVILSPWDAGLFFFFYGLLRLKKDPMLARSSWARFLGKNWFFLRKLTSR